MRPSWRWRKKLAEWPRLVEIAARSHEPHRIAFYLYELASDFHALWNRGNDDPALRFVQEGDSDATQAKIALLRAVAIVISARSWYSWRHPGRGNALTHRPSDRAENIDPEKP